MAFMHFTLPKSNSADTVTIMSTHRKPRRAIRMLVFATALWGLSFPTTKALALARQQLLPGSGSWFSASLCVVYRFAIAALIQLSFCALGGYTLMNRWQRHVPATKAGLIHCLEPVCAGLFALFLPAWFSAWSSTDYANERWSANLLAGGALITAADVLIHLPSATRRLPATGLDDPSAVSQENQVAG